MKKRLFLTLLVLLTATVLFANITRDDALAIALKEAGVTRNDVSRVEVERDREHGLVIYEIEFRNRENKWEYDISDLGDILSYKVEKRNIGRHDRNATLIERSRAEEIIKSHLPEDARIFRVSRDFDDGFFSYEADAALDDVDFEIEIDAVTGDLISFSREQRRY